MKLFLLAFAAFVNFTLAATPTPVFPDELPIGFAAAAKAKASMKKLDVYCTGSNKTYYDIIDISTLSSDNDLIAILNRMNIQMTPDNPNARFSLECNIYGPNGISLFRASQQFKPRKTGYDLSGKPVYEKYIAHLYFALTDITINVPGAESAELIDVYGQAWAVNVYEGGRIIIPGWMNSGQFKELVINGNIRYDMVSGSRVTAQAVQVQLASIQFEGVPNAVYDNGVYVIRVSPQYGLPPAFQVNTATSSFRVRVENGQGEGWASPIMIRYANKKSLNSGIGSGWTKVRYSSGMKIQVDEPGEYWVYPEFSPSDVGTYIYESTPTTPVGGGQG